MTSPSRAITPGPGLLLQLSLLLLLFVIQVEAVEISLRSYFDRASLLQSVWAPLYDARHYVFSFVIAFPAIALMVLWPRLSAHWSQFLLAAVHHRRGRTLCLQLLAYLAFAWLTFRLSFAPELFGSYLYLVFALWFGAMLATAWLALLVLAPAAYWRDLAYAERWPLLFAATAALLANGIAQGLSHALPMLTELTLQMVRGLLAWVHSPIVYDPAQSLVGTSQFAVRVTNDCAGYEGITLVTLFTGVYLWLFRRDFRFPRALLVLPIGILVIAAFNVVRIVLLIGLGHAVSPALAMAGFHSNAGWIAFICVTVVLLVLLHGVPWFRVELQRGVAAVADRQPVRMADALLLPLLVSMAAALLLGMLTVDFDWTYPLKVMATAAVLLYFRKHYELSAYRPDLASVSIGIAVFVLWMVLVPAAPEDSSQFAATLAGLPPAVLAGWLLFRCIGSVITVPLAEELAFRGYLLTRLAGQPASMRQKIPFNLIAFGVSSLLFGLLHGAWEAGILAGMAYAWARYRRGETGDAIVAHMTTNGLLSAYVLWSGEWSYW